MLNAEIVRDVIFNTRTSTSRVSPSLSRLANILSISQINRVFWRGLNTIYCHQRRTRCHGAINIVPSLTPERGTTMAHDKPILMKPYCRICLCCKIRIIIHTGSGTAGRIPHYVTNENTDVYSSEIACSEGRYCGVIVLTMDIHTTLSTRERHIVQCTPMITCIHSTEWRTR